MPKRLIIYDVEESCQSMFMQEENETILFSASPEVSPCIGCFGCWIKTPGQCVIKDRCTEITSYLAQCREVNIVSPIVYGGYSPSIKAILDRSIGYILPYFRIIENEMHHQMRYENSFSLCVHFYGTCSEEEMDIARRLVKANCINFGVEKYSVNFYNSAEQIGACIFSSLNAQNGKGA